MKRQLDEASAEALKEREKEMEMEKVMLKKDM